MLLFSSSSWTPRSNPTNPRRQPLAPLSASETPPCHKGSVCLCSYSLLPPLIQLFVSFFQDSPGPSLCRCCFCTMAGWQRETSGERLSTAASHASSPTSSSSYQEFSCRPLIIPVLQQPLNYHFEIKNDA